MTTVVKILFMCVYVARLVDRMTERNVFMVLLSIPEDAT